MEAETIKSGGSISKIWRCWRHSIHHTLTQSLASQHWATTSLVVQKTKISNYGRPTVLSKIFEQPHMPITTTLTLFRLATTTQSSTLAPVTAKLKWAPSLNKNWSSWETLTAIRNLSTAYASSKTQLAAYLRQVRATRP